MEVNAQSTVIEFNYILAEFMDYCDPRAWRILSPNVNSLNNYGSLSSNDVSINVL